MKDTDISNIDFENKLKNLIMNSYKASIYFTVTTGMGYGMIIVLSILITAKIASFTFNVKLIISIINFLLISSGLLSSTLNFDRTERDRVTISQWKSSWVSREKLFAIITFVPLILFYLSWIVLNNEILTKFFLIFSALLSLITVYCTAKIYSSLKTIPAWHNPFVPILYILNGFVSGSLILFLIFFYFKIESYFLHNFIIIILPTTLFLKLLYWYSIKKPKMKNDIDKSKLISFRGSCIILTYVTPVYCLLQTSSLVVNYEVSVITYSISTFFTKLITSPELYFSSITKAKSLTTF